MTLSDAAVISACPTCNATLRVTTTRASGPHLRCTGPAGHTFDLRASTTRGTGRVGDGVPVHRDEPCAMVTA